MSNALAIAGVSAVLRDLLDNGLIDHQVTDALGAGVTVSSLAPDVVPIDGDRAVPRLNLFLYQVTPNAAWRNVDLPSCDAGGRRVSNPPLALDLHYLLTAYGIEDLQAEVLLGYGMQLLHENPVLSRAAIRTALNPSPVNGALLPSVYQALRSADLAEQVEMLKITPAPMNTEEMSRLWSALTGALSADCRISGLGGADRAAAPAFSPLPVLTRGQRIPGLERVRGRRRHARIWCRPTRPSSPALVDAHAPARYNPSSATSRCHHLAGTARVIVLRSDRFRIKQEIPLGNGIDDAAFDFTLPDLPSALPVGLYQLQLAGTACRR